MVKQFTNKSFTNRSKRLRDFGKIMKSMTTDRNLETQRHTKCCEQKQTGRMYGNAESGLTLYFYPIKLFSDASQSRIREVKTNEFGAHYVRSRSTINNF